MTRLGLIVRADQGGLGNQTWEIWRHLRPAHTVVVQLGWGHARGTETASRYDDDATTVWPVQGAAIPDPTLHALCTDLDVLMTVEGWYNPRTVTIAREHGVQTVKLANPELFPAWEPAPDRVYLPTSWEQHRVPGAQLLPQPVALDRFQSRQRLRFECRTFYHPWAPAMMDRNGTDLVMSALRFVTEPCRLIVRAPVTVAQAYQNVPTGNVEVLWVKPSALPYWECYPDDADVQLLPRRYGGLCLPAQEAAACGMPTVMLDTPPSGAWPFIPVHAIAQATGQMKGGEFQLYGCDPAYLAAVMNNLTQHPALVESYSQDALDWSVLQSWGELLPAWQRATNGETQ